MSRGDTHTFAKLSGLIGKDRTNNTGGGSLNFVYDGDGFSETADASQRPAGTGRNELKDMAVRSQGRSGSQFTP